MLINSINWLIDCKKALTSRQPQSCTWQPSWPGLLVQIYLSVRLRQPLSEEEEEEEGMLRRVSSAQAVLQVWLGSLRKQPFNVIGELGKSAPENGEKTTVVMWRCASFTAAHLPLSSSLFRWQTCHNPPTTPLPFVCYVCYHADMPRSRLP